jgi:hypothetical protein
MEFLHIIMLPTRSIEVSFFVPEITWGAEALTVGVNGSRRMAALD